MRVFSRQHGTITMLTTLYNAFIPHPGNNHKPHALRTRALSWYAFILITVKVVTALVMFVVYPDPALVSTDIKQEMIELINASRNENGLPPLAVHAELDRAAQNKAADMLLREYFDHTTPDGALPWTFIDTTSYRYRTAGENLAVDFASGKIAHQALMKSALHRANILSSSFNHVGIGVVSGNFQGRETTLLVEFFGSPAAEPKSKPALINTAQAAEAMPKNSVTAAAETVVSTEMTPPEIKSEETSAEELPETPTTTPRNNVTVVMSDVPETIPETLIIADEAAVASSQQLDNKTIEAKTDSPDITMLPIEDANITAEESTPTPVAMLTVTPTPPLSGNQIQKNISPAITSIKTRSTQLDVLHTINIWTKRLFLATLMYLTFTLIVAMIVRIRVQHLDVIGQTLALIIVVATLASTHWHTIERLTNEVKII